MTDVVVIGGGIVGGAVAAHLASSGRSVVLVEQSAVGAGASGRNSGVVQHPFDPVLIALHEQTLALYRALPPAPGIDFTLPTTPAGLLMVSHDADRARDQAAMLAVSHPGLRPTYLAPGEVHALEPVLAGDAAAVRLEMGYPVAPEVATNAYAAWARASGVDVRIGHAARPWHAAGATKGVVLDDGARIAAADVVVAAGPWSPALVDPSGTWRPIRALWGVVVEATVADPPRHVIEEAEADLEPGAADEPATHAFSLVTAAGRSTIGSTFLAAEPDPVAELPVILARARSFVPRLDDAAQLGRSRVCARPLSEDGRPLIGPVPGIDGLWIAAGHGPWGISTGPAAGPMLVRAMDGQPDAIPAALDPGRFGPVPLPPTSGPS